MHRRRTLLGKPWQALSYVANRPRLEWLNSRISCSSADLDRTSRALRRRRPQLSYRRERRDVSVEQTTFTPPRKGGWTCCSLSDSRASRAQPSLPAGGPALRSAFELRLLPSGYIGLLPILCGGVQRIFRPWSWRIECARSHSGRISRWTSEEKKVAGYCVSITSGRCSIARR